MGDSNHIQVRFQGTKAQETQFLNNCRRTEAMFALTLMKRFEIEESDENHAIVASWLQSARDMGVGNFISSGLSAELVDPDKPTVVCLCGSTRFMEAFQAANLKETMAGRIVLSVGCDTKSDTDIFKFYEYEDMICMKGKLDELHKRKIDIADEILVLNVGGYIGESTRSEILYAMEHGKDVRWLETPTPQTLEDLGFVRQD